MTRRTRIIWTAVAAVFTAINLGGAVFAAVAQESIHAGVHVVLGIVGLYLTWRLSPWRVIDRLPRDYSTNAELPADQMDRLSQIERSVDAVAIEVERIGEGQRFMTKVLTEKDASPPRAEGAVEPPATPPDTKRR